jgi:CBS domain containing-hemolysin-like protein
VIEASQEAGLFLEAREEVVVRVLNIGEHRISETMTPRPEVDWIDAEDDRDEILQTILECPHEQLLVGRAPSREKGASRSGAPRPTTRPSGDHLRAADRS